MIFAAAWLAGSIAWPYIFYGVIDPLLRRAIGAALGVRIVWSYDNRYFFGPSRNRKWNAQ